MRGGKRAEFPRCFPENVDLLNFLGFRNPVFSIDTIWNPILEAVFVSFVWVNSCRKDKKNAGIHSEHINRDKITTARFPPLTQMNTSASARPSGALAVPRISALSVWEAPMSMSGKPVPEIVYQTCQHCPIFTIVNLVQMVDSKIWNLEFIPEGGSLSNTWHRKRSGTKCFVTE
jgi:hypothetical protein